SVYRQEFTNRNGKLKMVISHYYDPDTHKQIEMVTDGYRDDGSLEWETMHFADATGKETAWVSRGYDKDGNQTDGRVHDEVNGKMYTWNPATQKYDELKPPEPEKAKATPPSQPAPPVRKPGDISYQPTELGMIVPSNLQAGDTFSASIMSAKDAK